MWSGFLRGLHTNTDFSVFFFGPFQLTSGKKQLSVYHCQSSGNPFTFNLYVTFHCMWAFRKQHLCEYREGKLLPFACSDISLGGAADRVGQIAD